MLSKMLVLLVLLLLKTPSSSTKERRNKGTMEDREEKTKGQKPMQINLISLFSPYLKLQGGFKMATVMRGSWRGKMGAGICLF